MTDDNRASQDPFIGRVIDGRYHVNALLGRGAAATVYSAHDRQSGGPVALKRWHREKVDEQVLGRFAREATALRTVHHPNIVQVIDHGLIDQVPYVVMERLQGQTLRELLLDGRLQPPLALEIAKQMLAAIAHAHRRDLVHRDLKPDNVFIVSAEVGPWVKILDYGLAKFMSPEADPTKGVALTMTGMMMGTLLYMPPEQAAGSSVDLPVDVYSAGCVLFEMLTGRPPYQRETEMELVGAHMRAPIPRLDEALPGARVAPQLQAVIDRSMAKKQTDRYPNAGRMLKAIEALPQQVLTLGGAGAGRPGRWIWLAAPLLLLCVGALVLWAR